VQISAPGAEVAASTEFLRTKAAADARLRESTLTWTILRPGLVLSAQAYGGTSLSRMLAAFPVAQPLVLGDARVQIVSAEDVSAAVSSALRGALPAKRDYDLMSAETHTLRELVAAFRAWLGFPPAAFRVEPPIWVANLLARGADAAGWLGWRAPLRTTALRVLADGVTGDPTPYEAATGRPCKKLAETLAALPSTAQERVYARAQLLFPVLLLVLSGFWIASGLFGFLRADAAMSVLGDAVSRDMAEVMVVGGAMLDLCVGGCLLWRPWSRAAAWMSVLVCIAYLLAGSLLTPFLWGDPLGSLVKIFPAMALGLAVAALNVER
jgi:hypothetical protein